jgi:hypothetical protein
MCRFIKYRDSHTGETVYVNLTSVTEAKYSEQDNRLEVTIGNPIGECRTAILRGKEAEQAKAALDGICK